MKKDIISLNELSRDELINLIDLASDIKRNPELYKNKLNSKTLLLLFQKTSTRTRISFELGMKKLGGFTLVMDWNKSNFSLSPIKYEAMYVSRMADIILARLIKNEAIIKLAEFSLTPVINGCCDMYHPTQVLSDLLTIYETKKSFDTTITYVGIQNNVANSLFHACNKVGINLIFVTPIVDKKPKDFDVTANNSKYFAKTLDLKYAVSKSEFLYTDTWINMELVTRKDYMAENDRKIKLMKPYQINKRLIEGKNLYIMHDMPVHPGFEIDEYSLDCERSIILQQAENRMYAEQALLLYLLDSI